MVLHHVTQVLWLKRRQNPSEGQHIPQGKETSDTSTQSNDDKPDLFWERCLLHAYLSLPLNFSQVPKYCVHLLSYKSNTISDFPIPAKIVLLYEIEIRVFDNLWAGLIIRSSSLVHERWLWDRAESDGAHTCTNVCKWLSTQHYQCVPGRRLQSWQHCSPRNEILLVKERLCRQIHSQNYTPSPIFVCQDGRNKVSQTGEPQHQKLIFSHFGD